METKQESEGAFQKVNKGNGNYRCPESRVLMLTEGMPSWMNGASQSNLKADRAVRSLRCHRALKKCDRKWPEQSDSVVTDFRVSR